MQSRAGRSVACLTGRPISRGRIQSPVHTLCPGREKQAGLLAQDFHRRPSQESLPSGQLPIFFSSLTAARPRRILTDFPTLLTDPKAQKGRNGHRPIKSGKLTPATASTVACDLKDSRTGMNDAICDHSLQLRGRTGRPADHSNVACVAGWKVFDRRTNSEER